MKPKVMRLFILLLTLAIYVALSQKGPSVYSQSGPPIFTRVAQTFTPVTLPPSSINPIMVGVAGGVIAYIQDDTSTGLPVHSLRFVTDPDRIMTIQGSGVPANGFELVNSGMFSSSTINISAASVPVIGAYDIDANTIRVIIAFQRNEGGCSSPDQLGINPCCTPGPDAVDLNGDGDLFDQVLQYSEIIIDKPSKNITSIRPMVNTGFVATNPSLATNGKIIAGLTGETSLSRSSCTGNACPVGQISCEMVSPGVDLNGDGFIGSTEVLRLYDIDTGVTTNTGLGTDALSCASDVNHIRYPDIAFPVSPAPMFVMGRDLLALVTRESSPQPGSSTPGPNNTTLTCVAKPGRDLNNDGDFNDLVIRYIDLNTFAVSNGPTISQNTENLLNGIPDASYSDNALIGIDGHKIIFTQKEQSVLPGFPPCNDPNDLNHNCQGGDTVLQIFDTATGSTTNVGIDATLGTVSLGPGMNPLVDHGIVAFMTEEFREGFGGADLNCDGDKGDKILHFLDLSSNTIVNTRIALLD